MSRKRLSKKQLRRDRFVESTFDWAHWAETHRRQVLVGVGALVMLVAAFFVYQRLARGAEEQAARGYLEARQAYFSGNYPLAVSDLQRFLDRHGDTSYADDARLFLADALYQAGDFQGAVESLREFLRRHQDSPYEVNARMLLAASYQALGQHEEASSAYHEALDEADFAAQRIRIYESLADLYELQGEKDRAAEALEAIVQLAPESSEARQARRDIAELTVEPISAGADETGTGANTPQRGTASADTIETAG